MAITLERHVGNIRFFLVMFSESLVFLGRVKVRPPRLKLICVGYTALMRDPEENGPKSPKAHLSGGERYVQRFSPLLFGIASIEQEYLTVKSWGWVG